jgi:RNA polymerase sigma-70 factor, ECF subfamily
VTRESGKPAREPAEVAIPRLLQEHGIRIHAMGLYMCRTEQDAEDLLQETFVRAYRGWNRFEGRASPLTWLYTIAARVARRQHRRRAGEPLTLVSLDRILPSGEAAIVDVPATEAYSLARVEREEADARVRAAVGSLPFRFRLPLVLKDLADFSISEIAGILELKENTVKTRVHRARMTLRAALAEALPRRTDLTSDHSRRICMDLLYAKQEALDRGVPFPLPQDQFCARCHAVFSTLDLTRDVFRQLHRGAIPEPVRVALKKEMADERDMPSE